MTSAPFTASLAALLLLAGCAATERETAVLERYPGAREQIITWYGNNATEQDAMCTGVEMTDITRATTVSDTAQELVLAIQYYWDMPGQSVRQGSQSCQGFGSRDVTFAKSAGGVTLQSMSGTRP